ncbi:hypothetical protein DTW89_00055 [Acidovorax sp. BoFeN1]|nr:hypothetical protein DTW89_00055 [Acidovorax sp. BoFeN1]
MKEIFSFRYGQVQVMNLNTCYIRPEPVQEALNLLECEVREAYPAPYLNPVCFLLSFPKVFLTVAWVIASTLT